jgi:hypothetical protein
MLINSISKPKQDELIIFNHIPKVGGTSIYYLFLTIWGTEKCFRHKARHPTTNTFSPSITNLPAEERQNLRFVMGHFCYGNHRLFPQPAYYIGVIRHPLQRLISDYFYNRERGQPKLSEKALNMTFEEYAVDKLENPKSQMTSNAQIRLLTGESNLDAARRVLNEEYLLACTTPQLDEFQIILQRFLNVTDVQVMRRNVTKHKDHEVVISQSTRDALLARNAIDLEFYNLIKARFDEVKVNWLQ